ncbi:MAG: hypothetical protein H0U74_01520 [Bradymonadaceae bacterium]|nr:hypothetical protein [Lujinxingiaceae bacterium]
MTNDIEDDFDDAFEADLDDNFEAELDGDIEIDDFEEESEFPEEKQETTLVDTHFEGAVRANPKRMMVAQRRKASSIIEGIISDAELVSPDGQSKAWKKLNKKSDVSLARPYDIHAALTENDIVDHPRFGVGFVIQLLSPSKVEVLFESGTKRLACNQAARQA